MSNQPTSDPLWATLSGTNPVSMDSSLVTTLIYGEIALFTLTGVVFLLGSLILIFRTKEKGRYLIFSGITLLCSLYIRNWFSMRHLEINSILDIATIKFATAMAISLIALGYARLIWFLLGSDRPKNTC